MTDNNEIANKIFERLDGLGAQFMTTAPMVWEKMVTLTQFESIAYLISGAVCAVLCIICVIAASKAATDFNNRPNPRYDDTPVVVLLYGAATVFFVIPALVNLLYIWNWVGAFSPESRLIARLIGAVTQTD